MWTSKNGHDRSKLRYPRDLTDHEWGLVETLIPPGKTGGGKRTVIMREVVNGLILSAGCQWRAIPKDLPPINSRAVAYAVSRRSSTIAPGNDSQPWPMSRHQARELDLLIATRGRPRMIVSENDTEPTSNAILCSEHRSLFDARLCSAAARRARTGAAARSIKPSNPRCRVASATSQSVPDGPGIIRQRNVGVWRDELRT
jgi:transposase